VVFQDMGVVKYAVEGSMVGVFFIINRFGRAIWGKDSLTRLTGKYIKKRKDDPGGTRFKGERTLGGQGKNNLLSTTPI